MKTLESLSVFNKVNLVWVPGHRCIMDNEEADQLAREGSSAAFIGPELVLGVATCLVKAKISKWTNNQFQIEWQK